MMHQMRSVNCVYGWHPVIQAKGEVFVQQVGTEVVVGREQSSACSEGRRDVVDTRGGVGEIGGDGGRAGILA